MSVPPRARSYPASTASFDHPDVRELASGPGRGPADPVVARRTAGADRPGGAGTTTAAGRR
jgi:hypothetical protein